MKAEPFRIEIPQADLDDLRERLAHTRFAPDFANEDWSYGTPTTYLRALVDYWKDGFDWRAQEAGMNAFEHYRTSLDGIPVHFLLERGRGPSPIPIILTHGWPWTFWDYRKVIRPLADPASFGGDARDAFDVVVPSLPGFGFSSPLATPGVDVTRVAEIWDRLMRDVLGYPRYAAGGGDWGAFVTAQLGHAFADHLFGVHLSMPVSAGFDVRSVRPEDYGPGEEDWPQRMIEKRPATRSHLMVHSRDPQTIAAAFHDSPAGLASWIVEKRRAWSDCAGDVERCFSRDDLLTTVSIYWLTGTIGTSMRFYRENFINRRWKPSHNRSPALEAPAAYAVFPEDVLLAPRRAIERSANVQRWTVMPRGGHFAPAEQPELLIDDIRAFFRDRRE